MLLYTAQQFTTNFALNFSTFNSMVSAPTSSAQDAFQLIKPEPPQQFWGSPHDAVVGYSHSFWACYGLALYSLTVALKGNF